MCIKNLSTENLPKNVAKLYCFFNCTSKFSVPNSISPYTPYIEPLSKLKTAKLLKNR